MSKYKENFAKQCIPKILLMEKCASTDYPDLFYIVGYARGRYQIALANRTTIWSIKEKDLKIFNT